MSLSIASGIVLILCTKVDWVVVCMELDDSDGIQSPTVIGSLAISQPCQSLVFDL